MIKDMIRIVNKLDKDTATTRLAECLNELKEGGLNNSKKNIKSRLTLHIAESIVSATSEEFGREYARKNAIKRAMEFDSIVVKTMTRRRGRHDSLLVELTSGEIGYERAFVSTVDSLIRVVNNEENEMPYDVFVKCALIVAELLHVCGFSAIDIQVW